MAIGRHLLQLIKFCITLVKPTLGMGVAISAGVQLNHWRADPGGGFQLPCVSRDAQEVAQALGASGFAVTALADLDRSALAAAVRPD